MLDVRRLRVLSEVARQGSFSGAAEVLGYTQPAISRQIAVLEAETGVMLVRRLPQGVALTDAGQLLVDRAGEIFTRIRETEAELQALAGLGTGRLRIGSFSSAAATIVPLAVTRFREQYPSVQLEVVMADPLVSLPAIRAGELEMALSHELIDAEVPGIEHVHLFDDPMYVAMPASHPLADADELRLAAFAEEPWMLATATTCPDSRRFLRACHDAGFEPDIAFENDDYTAILGFVAAGVGVALIPDMVSRGVRNDVVVRELVPSSPTRPIMAAFPIGYRSPAAAAMLEVLRDVADEWTGARRTPAAA